MVELGYSSSTFVEPFCGMLVGSVSPPRHRYYSPQSFSPPSHVVERAETDVQSPGVVDSGIQSRKEVRRRLAGREGRWRACMLSGLSGHDVLQ